MIPETVEMWRYIFWLSSPTDVPSSSRSVLSSQSWGPVSPNAFKSSSEYCWIALKIRRNDCTISAVAVFFETFLMVFSFIFFSLSGPRRAGMRLFLLPKPPVESRKQKKEFFRTGHPPDLHHLADLRRQIDLKRLALGEADDLARIDAPVSGDQEAGDAGDRGIGSERRPEQLDRHH